MESFVTYEMVAGAIKDLLDTNEKVTVNRIREQLGNRGSNSTINKHLRAWRKESLIQNIAPEKLPERTKNILSEKLQNLIDDQKYLLDQSKKRNNELEQRLEKLEERNEDLVFENKKLVNDVTNKNNEIFKINLELKTQVRILEEVRSEHKSHIKFLEDNVERISNLAGQEFNNWQERYHNLYEKYQKMVIDFENQISKLKQSDLDKERERNAAMDNLIREVGRLKRELSLKEPG